MLSSLLRLLATAFAAVVALAVVLGVIGVALGIAGFLLFKVAPLILVGYVITRLLAPRRRLAAADREWLES